MGNTRWGDWSEWYWNDDYQRNYRMRQDAKGNIDYQWQEASPTPRGVGEVTTNLEDMSISPRSRESADDEYQYEAKGKSKSKKSKGKERAHKHESSKHAPSSAHLGERAHHEDDPYTDTRGSGSTDPYGGSHDSYLSDQHSAYELLPATTGSTLGGPSDAYGFPDDEDDFEAAMGASRQEYSFAQRPVAGGPSGSSDIRSTHGDARASTPKPIPDMAIARDEDYEVMDPRYRIENSEKFQPGEIFKVYWSEPLGSKGNTEFVSGRKEGRNQFGLPVWQGFRRFIVIANDLGHCTCVPITTYGGKGLKKKGQKPDKHGIIYEINGRAKLLEGEPKLGFPPVRVEMNAKDERITKESRVNYSKLVTVEHNVDVFFIGNVYFEDIEIVSDAVDHCWGKKSRHKKKSRP